MDDSAASPSSPAMPPLSRDERRVRAAAYVLRTTIRDLYLARFNARTPQDAINLSISMRVSPAENWKLDFDPPLIEQVMPQLAEGEAAREVFKAGHVFCFRCDSASCEHSAPGSAPLVFKGYDSTGRPEWQEFAQALIDARDERVEWIYARPPKLVSLFQYGRELKGRQLLTFGKASLSYSILAQVIAGYFDLNGERLAISLQIVEGRNRDGALTLKLNTIGWSLQDSVLLDWLSADKTSVLFRAMQIAERELARIETLASHARSAGDHARANQIMARIPGVARRLADALIRGGRQDDRRTRHATERRQDRRPVHKAWEDAMGADSESWYFDQKAETFIVTGERGRVHAFSTDGKHVTSFNMKPATVEFRLRTDRWRRASPDESSLLKPLIASPRMAAPGDHDESKSH